MAEVGHVSVRASASNGPSLMCVANFEANAGYAWDFIEGLYARLADRFAPQGVATWVAYPAVKQPPKPLAGSAARPVELNVRLGDLRCMAATLRFVRENRVRVLYMADRPSWHPAYLLLRLAGVRRIIVHDHTSGARTIPRGLKRVVKYGAVRGARWMLADDVVGVSDYVAKRKVEVDLVPASRVRRIWNSLELPVLGGAARSKLRRAFGLPDGAKVVACACRASRVKGIEHLLRAFDRITSDATLIYMGEGPDLERLRQISN